MELSTILTLDLENNKQEHGKAWILYPSFFHQKAQQLLSVIRQSLWRNSWSGLDKAIVNR